MFGNRRAAAITRTEVREWSERLADEKPVVANRAFAVMRRSYEWALGRDLVQSSPFVGIHKPTPSALPSPSWSPTPRREASTTC